MIYRYQHSNINDNDKGVCNSDDFITRQISRWRDWPWYTCCPRFQKAVDPPHRHPRNPREITIIGKEMVRERNIKLLQCCNFWQIKRTLSNFCYLNNYYLFFSQWSVLYFIIPKIFSWVIFFISKKWCLLWQKEILVHYFIWRITMTSFGYSH